MSEEQIKILNYLNEHAVGYSNRKSSDDIQAYTGFPSGGPTNEHIRALIRDMILNHGACIGSIMYESGYWIIDCKEELDQVVKSLEDRASGVLNRSEALKRNWDKRNE